MYEQFWFIEGILRSLRDHCLFVVPGAVHSIGLSDLHYSTLEPGFGCKLYFAYNHEENIHIHLDRITVNKEGGL